MHRRRGHRDPEQGERPGVARAPPVVRQAFAPPRRDDQPYQQGKQQEERGQAVPDRNNEPEIVHAVGHPRRAFPVTKADAEDRMSGDFGGPVLPDQDPVVGGFL